MTQQDFDSPSDYSIPPTNIEFCRVRDILSKCSVSYSSTGVNVEVKVTSATELRSLVDAFSKLCPSTPATTTTTTTTTTTVDTLASPTKGSTLYRNKLYKSKPVNFFSSVYNSNHLIMPSCNKSSALTLRQIGDACIDTYFSCWVRYSPIIDKNEFMAWYNNETDPMKTLIVNAICSLVFGHTVTHHSKPGLEKFRHDQDLVRQQQDLFFERARKYLELSFDAPDRWTVVALLYMSCTAEPARRHHYSGMAVSALLELEIYPRMVLDDDDDSFEKEMDTRLWWFTWSLDFYLYSTGIPRNTPRTNRMGQVDTPKIFEQDIDQVEEHGVLADIYCLKWWRFQADVIADVYEQDENNMTDEQLQQYDNRLLRMYQSLPQYLQWNSGFAYGSEDLFMVCVRVNVEFNATRIILHMPFLPDPNNLHPTPLALQSLNICIKTALMQLETLDASNKDGRRCSFDRDELWRAGEIISLGMDVYRNCTYHSTSSNCDLLLKNINRHDYESGLHRAMSIMQDSLEFKMGRKDWMQVNDWLRDEIARHDRLNTPLMATNPIKMEKLSPPPPTDFIAFCPDNSSKKSNQSRTFNNTRKQPRQRQQSATRFRYFNPRTMNKFLFIDDHPLL
ncbi:hypothetical protein BC941DRAFT_346011 [Chlamydoabsidia padenii]|nr:hypothetical protein BC941DRAFT_346011 [Chlamydoabsidia padenii]